MVPPKRDFNHRVTQFRRQDLPTKETGAQRAARRAGKAVVHFVPETAPPRCKAAPLRKAAPRRKAAQLRSETITWSSCT